MEILSKNKPMERYHDYSEDSAYNKYKRGEISKTDYLNVIARRHGYKDVIEYNRERAYRLGIFKRKSENKECSHYLGTYIAESVLSKVFENVQKMSVSNIGYDFICKNGYKVDVKSACLGFRRDWNFHIKYNNITDYFLLIAFDNRGCLTPMYIWLIRGDEIIKTQKFNKPFNERDRFTVINNKKSSEKYKKYEITDKLDKVKEICEIFKKEHNIQKKEELPKLKIIFPRKENLNKKG